LCVYKVGGIITVANVAGQRVKFESKKIVS